MTIFLENFDAAPLSGNEFTFDFNQWIAVLIDTLNEVVDDIQGALNLLTAQSYTDVEIATLQANSMLTDGIILYDSVNTCYVGRISGVLVKFTTGVYP
jgi:hypothetical protein